MINREIMTSRVGKAKRAHAIGRASDRHNDRVGTAPATPLPTLPTRLKA
jgi:hypothetical protein